MSKNIFHLSSGETKRSKIVKQLFFFASLITFALFCNSESKAQVVAGFEAVPDRGCSELLVQFNDTSKGSNLTYYWDFGTGDTSTVTNPLYLYTYATPFEVMLIVTNSLDPTDADTAYRTVDVDYSPNLDFTISNPSVCSNEPISFTYFPASNPTDKITWDFGDGNIITSKDNPITHKYDSNGSFVVTLYSYFGSCGDTTPAKPVTVAGPLASFSMSAKEGCVGDDITFTLGDTSGVDSIIWLPEGSGGARISNINPYTHSYPVEAPYLPLLEVYGSSKCTISDTNLRITSVKAEIGYGEDEFCDQRLVYFDNLSSGTDTNDTYLWDLGNGNTSTDFAPTQAYDAGNYKVKLRLENSIGCSDTTSDDFTIYDLPTLVVGRDTTICFGDAAQLFASGGTSIVWSPAADLDNPNSYTPLASPDTLTIFEPVITDAITKCSSVRGTESQTITVIKPPEIIFEVAPTDTTIYIGASFTIRTDSNSNYTYLWTPELYLSCTNCASPTITPLAEGDYTYTVSVQDLFECGLEEADVRVLAEELYTIGVSEAFTPNGDGVNDYIMVDGWGVKELVEFSIYNRWGNKVYSTADINDLGWDGMLDGKEQSIDTYTYYIKAEMLDDSFIEKRGAVSLYR